MKTEETFGYQETSEDEFDDPGVLTQDPEDPACTQEGYGYTQYLKREQEIVAQQMSVFQEHQKIMHEHLIMRTAIAAKKFKK